jgi:predicted aspartyl protease
MAAEGAFFAGRYSEAALHAAHVLASPGSRPVDEIEAMEQLKRIAELLTNVSPQALLDRGSGAPVAVWLDKVGLIRLPVVIGTATQEAVIDTGANLSVVSASTARRLGLRMTEGDAAVGNSLGGDVAVRLGIADRLEIAGALLSNVVFLVMDDEALTFPVPGGYRIDAIIGLPVLRALGRFSFEASNSFRVEPMRFAAATATNLRMSGSDPYVVVAVAGKEHPLFLDTGANSSLLAVRFAREHPELKGTQRLESGRAGAGGVERVHRQKIEQVPIRVGRVEANLSSLKVETEPTPGEEDRYGVLGADLLRTFERVTLDFQAMTLEVDAPA